MEKKNIDVWYNNPYIIFEDLQIFIPYSNLSPNGKKNSLVRLSIYTTIILFISKRDLLWYLVPVIILVSSFLINSEKFINDNQAVESTDAKPTIQCYKPTKDNPFMNYTVGDLMSNSKRDGACNYVDMKEEINYNFEKSIDNDIPIKLIDTSNIWGNFTSNRNFYTMPNTKIVNDQTEFANWCFGDSGNCKSKGKDCLKVRDPTYHRGRIMKLY